MKCQCCSKEIENGISFDGGLTWFQLCLECKKEKTSSGKESGS